MARTLLSAALLLAIAGGPAQAADLDKIDRTVAKEPTYQSKTPKYCLAVFGKEAGHRVWLVRDGDVFYIDRNANGDLTERNERVELPKADKNNGGLQQCDLGELALPGRNGKSPKLQLMIFPPDDGVYVTAECQYTAYSAGTVKLAAKPADAPVLHFDGPLTFAHMDAVAKIERPFTRGGTQEDLRVWIGTPGSSTDLFTSISYQGIPETIHPVAEIVFPAKSPGGETIKKKVVLSKRC